MKIKLMCAALFMALPAAAIAGGYTGSFKIVEYHLDQNTGGVWNLWIKSDQTVPANPDHCTNTLFYVLPMNYDYSKERYSAILAAYLSGKSIEVYVAGCFGTSPNDYPLVDQSRFKIGD